jgi:hypothetical protein
MADQYSKDMTTGVEQRGNVITGFLAGLFAAAIGAAIWMAVKVGLHLEWALVAIVIGAMVGFAVRVAGQGSHPLFGIIGALLTFAGCFTGEILTLIYRQVSDQHDFYYIATTSDYTILAKVVFSHTDAIGWVIYAVALYEGYKFSIAKRA